MPQDNNQEIQPAAKTTKINGAGAIQMPDSGQQDINGGLYSGTIGLRPEPKSHDIPPSPTEEFEAPYKVTTACAAKYSPFYDVEAGDEEAIGIEDKLLGHTETLDAKEAPLLVAKRMASDGKSIRRSIIQFGGKEGDDRFILAKRLLSMSEDKLYDFIDSAVKSNSAYGRQTLSVFMELGIVFNAYMRRVNTQVLEPADRYRQGVYRELRLIDAKGSFRTRGRSSDNGPEEKLKLPDKYEKQKIETILAQLSAQERSDWLFLRALVSRLSVPKVRKRADLLIKAFH